MKCTVCKSSMKPLLTTWYCPNDCDRPKVGKSPIFSHVLGGLLYSGVFAARSSQIPKTFKCAKWVVKDREYWEETANDFSKVPWWVNGTSIVREWLANPECDHWRALDSRGESPMLGPYEVMLVGAAYLL